jgi:hypothetical protein
VKNRDPASLLPYLTTAKAKIFLKVSLIREDPPIPGNDLFPFLVLDDTNPLARLIEAYFMTDAGSELKRVFLIVQRDRYILRTDDVWPVTNLDVDNSWRRAFTLHAQKSPQAAPIVLSNQVDDEGTLQPLESLFFCVIKKLFFAPPCPFCGTSLVQCHDDDLLIGSGLEPYSTSLRRYLFCRSCTPKEDSAFYVYASERSDPPRVRDRFALMKEFSRLALTRKEFSPFPCAECQDSNECYGSENRVLSRVFPFSFYPYYLLISEAMSLSASDFLPLLSGAAVDEPEGRQWATLRKRAGKEGPWGPAFLFQDDDRLFLEMLYLKLSFLGDLIQGISIRQGVKHPDLRLSMERIWVNLKDDPGGRLPFLWNFKVKILDSPGLASATESLLRLPVSYDMLFLGHAWFYVLLANQKQTMSRISLSLREGLNQTLSDKNFSSEAFLKGESDPLFHPSNIFWNPGRRRVHETWHPLWGKSLHLGWSLLTSSFRPEPSWSKEGFQEKIESLRGEVKHQLFAEKPPGESGTYSSENEEDRAIYDILTTILRKWGGGGEIEKDLEETVVLTHERARALAEEETLHVPSPNKEAKEDIPETIILSAPKTFSGTPINDSTSRDVDHPSVKQDAKEDEFLAETIVLGPRKAPTKAKDGNK